MGSVRSVIMKHRKKAYEDICLKCGSKMYMKYGYWICPNKDKD